MFGVFVFVELVWLVIISAIQSNKVMPFSFHELPLTVSYHAVRYNRVAFIGEGQSNESLLVKSFVGSVITKSVNIPVLVDVEVEIP